MNFRGGCSRKVTKVASWAEISSEAQWDCYIRVRHFYAVGLLYTSAAAQTNILQNAV